jgi:hypothetical protein
MTRTMQTGRARRSNLTNLIETMDPDDTHAHRAGALLHFFLITIIDRLKWIHESTKRKYGTQKSYAFVIL